MGLRSRVTANVRSSLFPLKSVIRYRAPEAKIEPILTIFSLNSYQID